jgi:hypothetical protein
MTSTLLGLAGVEWAQQSIALGQMHHHRAAAMDEVP